jgi:hypothetical protein
MSLGSVSEATMAKRVAIGGGMAAGRWAEELVKVRAVVCFMGGPC